MQQKEAADSLHPQGSEQILFSGQYDSDKRDVLKFEKFLYLPVELREKIWKESVSKNTMHFVKIVRLRDDGTNRLCCGTGEPFFFKPTFSSGHTPWEERLDVVPPLVRKPEPWWYTRRPPKASPDSTQSIAKSCREARPICLKEKSVELDVLINNPEHESNEFDYFMQTSEFAMIQRSRLYINPGSDILCLQAGNLEVGSSDGKAISLSTAFPKISWITKIAIEFHGPTTREWCCCYDGRDRSDGDSPSVVHDLGNCAQRPTRTCGKECKGCESCDSYYNSISHLDGLMNLLDEFPAVDVLFLIDWGYEHTDTAKARPYCSSEDHDFFQIRGKVGWKAERPCPFESLDCAERIETSFIVYLEFKIRELRRKIESHGNDEDLERILNLVQKRAQKPLVCQVLAAIQRPDGRKGLAHCR